MVPRVKGTQDFLDLSLYNFVIERAKKQLQLYHFTEIATPILEAVELFNRSLGLYTEVVTKEMFVITTTGEEEAICLRPEGTASTVRAFIEHQIQPPWKVFSYGPMFRYERPQKGRYRQFHQINMEIIGTEAIEQDVQLIKMLDRFFHEELSLNSYALLINFLGCFDDRKTYQLLLKDFLEGPIEGELCSMCLDRKERNIMRIFDCKNPLCQKIYKNAPTIVDNLCKPCAKEWQQLQDELSLLSISYAYQPTLVRGLDYYNKTVFEFVSKNLGAQNTFCGGGRYDQLVGQLGAKEDHPSLGAAIGIERLLLLLEPFKDQLPLASLPALHVIMPITSSQYSLALLLADELQAQNLCIDILLAGDSVKSMMRKANKMGAAYALILGEEEQKTRTVSIKNMTTGKEEQVLQIEAAQFVKK
ncbi:MAG: histidine--tRNA ligase [Candidatus Babeliales bacterium]